VTLLRRIYRNVRSNFPLERKNVFSIGIYTGGSPFGLSPLPTNPVLTARHVTDVPARYVADPFLVHQEDRFYLFFEVWNLETNNGQIGLAMSDNGRDWCYQQIILREPFHLSYPYIFGWRGSFYMIPESGEAESVRLYVANPFPVKWSYVGTLVNGYHVDSSIVRHHDRWWLLTANDRSQEMELRVYSANELSGPWISHPANPVVISSLSARPCGRVFHHQKRLFRVGQDCSDDYGLRVRALEILKLTEFNYLEKEISQGPLLDGSGVGWNAKGMHHMDVQDFGEKGWVAAVDGWTERLLPRDTTLELVLAKAASVVKKWTRSLVV
jgi:hypothetical protein